ncbi:hypothetical protein NC653_034457 [Populus alba x Populus x berolinensis]|uniref:Uncharacterized protein n=1 Tax=Populus alba x Populus x berolinensis TaxID=444605 RepID=A0AAD6LQG4_9ROSI|nr:hypothetical protein NC653_034457 [Populus alba x Populus x berolinensis]
MFIKVAHRRGGGLGGGMNIRAQ